MTTRFLIGFLSCIAGLIGSEYFLLNELFSGKRPPVLAVAAGALLGSVLFLGYCYRKFRKSGITLA
ncbi:hypothetical protein [Flaviaesturariibacter amylovorans]|uniref:Uncharacterized protein n=1 Tax=Flaviaesturariibacter amylovorans TaxID=1084520 RepID=A0ABP8G8U9_9BACT